MQNVIAQFHRRADEGEGEDSSGKGGVPPRWQEWLDKVHQGGREKVSNPNPATRDAHPQVSYTTALKQRLFFQKAMKEYYEWAKKNPEDKGSKKEKPKEEEKPSSSKNVFSSEKDVSALAEKHKADFDRITKSMKAKVGAYEKKLTKGSLWQEKFSQLSDAEKAIHVAGHEIGVYFEEKVLKDKEYQEDYMSDWRVSSGGKSSHELHGLMKSLGVKGSLTPKEEEEADKYKRFQKNGAEDDRLKAYAKEVYDFTQAYFRHVGLKEFTMFRGVSGQSLDKDPPAKGDEVQFKTRELSSFTTDADTADGYGRAIEFKVPVEKIFASCLTRPKIGSDQVPASIRSFGEAEMIVLGASDLKGKIINGVSS